VSRGDAWDRKADYGLAQGTREPDNLSGPLRGDQDDRAPPASRCVHLWFSKQEVLETDQTSMALVSRHLPSHLVQAVRSLWFATTKKQVLDAICVFLREPGWKMNPDSEGRDEWDIVQESKADTSDKARLVVSPQQPVEVLPVLAFC